MSGYSYSRGPNVRNKSERRNNAKHSIKKGEEIKENYNLKHMGEDERDYQAYVNEDDKKRENSKLNKTARRKMGSTKYNERHNVGDDDDLPSPSIDDLHGDLPTQETSVSPSPSQSPLKPLQPFKWRSSGNDNIFVPTSRRSASSRGGGFRKKSNKNRRSRGARTRSRRGVRKQK